VLRPVAAVARPDMVAQLDGLHAVAARRRFIARSVGFPVRHKPQPVRVVGDAGA
jgi:hypothetical protein